MSGSSKAEGTILPTTEDPVHVVRQDDPQPENLGSSAEQVDEIPGGDPPPPISPRSSQPGHDREQNDCFFKVIDVDIAGNKIVVQGECYSMNKLEDLFSDGKVPHQCEKTIRVILDGRRTGYGSWYSFPLEFPACWESRTIKDYDIEDCPFYSIPTSLVDGLFYHLPTLRTMMDGSGELRWYNAQCFAWHSPLCHNCPPRPTPFESVRYQKSDIHFTVDWSSGKNLPKLVCFAPNACCQRDDQSTWNDCASANFRLLKKLDKLLNMQQSVHRLTNGNTTRILQLLIHNVLSTIMDQIAEFLEERDPAVGGYKLLH